LSVVARHVALLLCVGGTACSSGTSDSSDDAGDLSSGGVSAKEVIYLTTAEKGQLCDWMVARAGSYGNPGTCVRSEPAATHPFLAYDDQADCVDDSPDAPFAACQATVAAREVCVSTPPACATLTDASQVPACTLLSPC